MESRSKENTAIFLVIVGLLGWVIPGAGYFLLKERKRAVIVFVTITATFLIGLYVGSIGVIDPAKSKPWYFAQLMNSPAVVLIANQTAGGGYPVYSKPSEIGQIYTGVSGLLNFLCVVNCVYLAYLIKIGQKGD